VKFIVHDQDREYEFLLSPGLYVVGRDPTCDLTLDSRRVSRRHMSCTVTENSVTVKDMGSRNRVRVGGVAVQEAVLKDGDEVRVGDVAMVFRAGGMTPAGAGQADEVPGAPVHAPAPEPTIEDDESTPELGSLVPQQAGEARPQVVERHGRWYVVDPSTRREVEIVPAGRPPGPPARRLLETTAGRLIAGGAVVAILIALVAVALRGPGGAVRDEAAGREFDTCIDSAIEALNRGETEEARRWAQQALALRPRSEAAGVVMELVELWDPWREDFFAHYRDVERALMDLYQLHSSRKVDRFRLEYKGWIDQELEYLRKANLARDAYQQARYEAAWQELKAIPEGSPVRERDVELFQSVRQSLHRYLRAEMRSAAIRQQWGAALQWARKLAEHFPEERQDTDVLVSRYLAFQSHAELMQAAKRDISDGRFTEAEAALRGIPEDSPYRGEALRLLERAKAGGQYARALALYDGGDAESALELLAGQDTDAARSLRRHIESVLALRKAALQEEEKQNLVRAQQHWQVLAQAETDPDNHYRKEALRALDGMQERRRELARRLAEQAAEAYTHKQYEKARQLYERAVFTDPDGRTGAEALEQMEERGEWDYRRALNLRDKDPREALRLFARACELLSPEHKYYQWATDEKRKLEQKLGAEGQ